MNFKLSVLLSSGLLLIASWSHAQEIAKGTVYLDLNQNGKWDKKETGIPNVAVSNGIAVVRTDSKGHYELPVNQDQIIFVIKPSGYTLPLDENHLAKSYYTHKPQGSPNTLKYKGDAPTGNLPKAIDFGLTAAQESDQFRMLVFGDPQLYNKHELSYFNRSIVDELVGVKDLAFGISLGDLVGDDLSLHPDYKASVARIGLPWYNVMGNHDMNYDVTSDSLSDEGFEKSFGPANYAFNYGKVHFIVLDNILYPNPRTGKGYLGGFRKDQLDFVANDLKLVPKDHLIVLAFHIPLQHQNGDVFRAEDRQRLFDLLADYPHTLSLSAHTHFQKQNFYTKADGWKQEKAHHEYNAGTTSGDWYSGQADERGTPKTMMRDGTPQGYAFIDFDQANYAIRYQVAGQPASYQIQLTHPKVVAQGKAARGTIYANFFMGHPNNKVEYSIAGRPFKKMANIQAADPSYLAELHTWDNSPQLLAGRRPSDAVDSDHLWRIAIPKDLSTGTHEIRIKATDDYGQIHEAISSIRVEEAPVFPTIH